MTRQRIAAPPRKPARRAVQARSRHTVETIVEAAARILARDGWPGFNTNAIARTAGVSIGSLYEYFENKEAVLAVIIDRHLAKGEARLAELAQVPAEGLGLEAIVDLLVEGFVSLHRDDPQLHRVLSAEVPLSARQRERIAAIRSNAIALLAGLLDGRVDRPWLRATIMVDTAEALTHRWFVDDLGAPSPVAAWTGELQCMLGRYIKE